MRGHLDLHAFRRQGTRTIVAVSITHLIQASLIWRHASGVAATSTLALIHVLRGLHPRPEVPILVGIIFMTASLGIAGSLLRLGRERLAILLPQHFILGVMAIGGWVAAWQGAYLDGTVIGWPHIVVDQILITTLWVVHQDAILQRAWDV